MAVIGDLVTRLSVDGRNFQNGLSRAQGQARSFAANVASIVSGIAIADIGGKAIGGIISLGQGVAKLAADAQTAQIQFEVLTGSAEKGAALFKDVERFAARTSFNLESAADASKALMAAGVSDTAVIPTLQLLGDLAMGDAVKLGFLSKAYTDVMNKGRLQGQEIRQFSENGVGLIGALSKSLNKSTAEILTMSEAGEISFRDMQKALLSLTGEGGRFNNMMARINETFTGQWNSLVENVQTLGREIGASVLPQLTSMLKTANELLQKFNLLPEKVKFLGEVLDASIAVLADKISKEWDSMLKRMVNRAISAGKEIATALNPGTWFGRAMDAMQPPTIGELITSEIAGNKETPQERLSRLLSQFTNQQLPPAPNANALNVAAAVDGSKLANLFGHAMEKAAPLIAGAKQFGDTKLAEWQMWGQGLAGMAQNWLGDSKPATNQTAGAQMAQSAEAFSTVVAAAFGGSQDPLLKETKNQTKQIVKAINKNAPGKAAPVFKEFAAT